MRKGSEFGVQVGFFLNHDTLNPGFSEEAVGFGGTIFPRPSKAGLTGRAFPAYKAIVL